MDAQFRLITSWITGDYGVFMVCAVIFLWAVVAFSFFRRRIVPVIKGVYQAIADVSSFNGAQEFAEGFEVLSEKLKRNPVFGHAWNEFEETLIKDPLLEPLAVRNTRSANEFFNRSSAISIYVSIAPYQIC